MDLKKELYKGYAIKFVEKIMGGKRVVIGEFPSKVTKRILGSKQPTKQMAFDACKKMIDKEYKVRGLK